MNEMNESISSEMLEFAALISDIKKIRNDGILNIVANSLNMTDRSCSDYHYPDISDMNDSDIIASLRKYKAIIEADQKLFITMTS